MLKNYYLTKHFYYLASLFALLFVGAYAFEGIFNIIVLLLILSVLILIADGIHLKLVSSKIKVKRDVQEKLSLGDIQYINYHISNQNKQPYQFEIFDNLPIQFQFRSSVLESKIDGESTLIKKHAIVPTTRGLYKFGKTVLFVRRNFPSLVMYKTTFENSKDVKVYPSIIQMEKYELQVFSKSAALIGVRRTRKIGESDEFEHIRPYLYGDNIKSINWKATSRTSQLKVNQYQNTRSQNVYCIVDKGRSMKMPFFEMTLLDHSINSALILSNIILRKYDNVGLVTFSDRIGSLLASKSLSGQLEKISEHLYNQKTGFKESNFELLYYTIRQQISQRSILIFYTNFEHKVDMERNLPYLRLLARKHLLVVILFINTELFKATKMKCKTKSDIYLKTTAQTALKEKENIAYKLRINGIQTILTKPEDLNIDVINKYLEIKSKLMI
ncbi:MAG: DUF58 domain-containing protein [Saprospiraceae bacterium]|nr:DUF58 domain-containing protein [Saprospiraceae bacterium]